MFSPAKFKQTLNEINRNLYEDIEFTGVPERYWDDNLVADSVSFCLDAGVISYVRSSNISPTPTSTIKERSNLYVFLTIQNKLFDYTFEVCDEFPGTWLRVRFKDRVYRMLDVADPEYSFDPAPESRRSAEITYRYRPDDSLNNTLMGVDYSTFEARWALDSARTGQLIMFGDINAALRSALGPDE